jgi:hypothetical protein
MSSLPDIDVDDWLIDEDEHAHVRYFKTLEVAYNSARNGRYGHAAMMAKIAAAMYDDMSDAIEEGSHR